jgi:hypothetical protein
VRTFVDLPLVVVGDLMAPKSRSGTKMPREQGEESRLAAAQLSPPSVHERLSSFPSEISLYTCSFDLKSIGCLKNVPITTAQEGAAILNMAACLNYWEF